jgi:peptide deformylase
MVRSGYNHIFMVNPEIKKLSRRESEYEEGCLSVSKGTRFMRISRPETVKVEYTSESGLRTTLRFNGLVSHTVQHEIDHLSGKLITDYVPSKGKKSV